MLWWTRRAAERWTVLHPRGRDCCDDIRVDAKRARVSREYHTAYDYRGFPTRFRSTVGSFWISIFTVCPFSGLSTKTSQVLIRPRAACTRRQRVRNIFPGTINRPRCSLARDIVQRVPYPVGPRVPGKIMTSVHMVRLRATVVHYTIDSTTSVRRKIVVTASTDALLLFGFFVFEPFPDQRCTASQYSTFI